MLQYIHWNVDPNIHLPIHLFTVQWYGLMWTLSIFGCFYLGKYIFKHEQLPEDHLVLLIQYIFIGAIIGARLGQVLFYNPTFFLQNPLEIIQVWHGGLASHGGVIGGLVAIYLFSRRYASNGLVWLLDRIAIIIYLPCSLIRLGNLFNSELVGKVTDVSWAFIFERVDMLPRHPVVLYESLAYLLLLVGCLGFYHFNKSIKPLRFTAIFFVATFSIRFLLEFMKEPEGMALGIISKTQFLSLPLIVVGLILMVKSTRDKSAQVNSR